MECRTFEPTRDLNGFFKIKEPPKTNTEINELHEVGIDKFKRKSSRLKIVGMPFLFSLIFTDYYINMKWGGYAPVVIMMMLGLIAFLLKVNNDDKKDFTYKLSEIDSRIITLSEAEWIAQCPDAKSYCSSVFNQKRDLTNKEYCMITNYVEDWVFEQKRDAIKKILWCKD